MLWWLGFLGKAWDSQFPKEKPELQAKGRSRWPRLEYPQGFKDSTNAWAEG